MRPTFWVPFFGTVLHCHNSSGNAQTVEQSPRDFGGRNMPSTQFVLTATSHHSELSFQDFGCGLSKQLRRATNHNEVSRGSQTHTHTHNGYTNARHFAIFCEQKQGAI